MTTFDEREQSFEAKFAHDEEMQFKARMRRNRFMAVWASALKGETVDQARAYAATLIKEDLKNVSEDDVVNAVLTYLGDLATEEKVRGKMQEFLVQAKEQVLSETD